MVPIWIYLLPFLQGRLNVLSRNSPCYVPEIEDVAINSFTDETRGFQPTSLQMIWCVCWGCLWWEGSEKPGPAWLGAVLRQDGLASEFHPPPALGRAFRQTGHMMRAPEHRHTHQKENKYIFKCSIFKTRKHLKLSPCGESLIWRTFVPMFYNLRYVFLF